MAMRMGMGRRVWLWLGLWSSLGCGVAPTTQHAGSVSRGGPVLQAIHSGPIRTVAFSPDSRFIVAADGTEHETIETSSLSLTDLVTGEVRASRQLDILVSSLQFDPSGENVVISGRDDEQTRLLIWDLVSDRVRSFAAGRILWRSVRVHPTRPVLMYIDVASPGGRAVVVRGFDGRERWRESFDHIGSADWASGGERVFVALEDRIAVLGRDGEQLASRPCAGVHLLSTHDEFVIAEREGFIDFLDERDGRVIRTIEVERELAGVELSRDGSTLLLQRGGDEEGEEEPPPRVIRIQELDVGDAKVEVVDVTYPDPLAMSLDGRTFFYTHEGGAVAQSRSGQLRHVHQGLPSFGSLIKLSPDGRSLAIVASRLYTVVAAAEVNDAPNVIFASSVARENDRIGVELAPGQDSLFIRQTSQDRWRWIGGRETRDSACAGSLVFAPDGSPRVRDLEAVCDFNGHVASATPLGALQSGTHVLSFVDGAHRVGTIYGLLASSTELQTTEPERSSCSRPFAEDCAQALALDGRYAAFVLRNSIELFETSSGERVSSTVVEAPEPNEREGLLRFTYFSPSGDLLAVHSFAGGDGSNAFYEVPQGRLRWKSEHRGEPTFSMSCAYVAWTTDVGGPRPSGCVSVDRDRSGEGVFRLFNALDGVAIITVDANWRPYHRAPSPLFSDDDSMVAVRGRNSVRVFSLPLGNVLREFQTQSIAAGSIANGTWIECTGGTLTRLDLRTGARSDHGPCDGANGIRVDGDIVTLFGGRVRIVDLRDDRALEFHAGPTSLFAVHDDGRHQSWPPVTEDPRLRFRGPGSVLAASMMTTGEASETLLNEFLSGIRAH